MDQIIDMSVAFVSRGVTIEQTSAVVNIAKRARKLVYQSCLKVRWVSDDILPFFSTLHLICSNWGSSYVDDWVTKDCFCSFAQAFTDTEFDVMKTITDYVFCCDPGILHFRRKCIKFLMKFAFNNEVENDEQAAELFCKLLEKAPKCYAENENYRNN